MMSGRWGKAVAAMVEQGDKEVGLEEGTAVFGGKV